MPSSPFSSSGFCVRDRSCGGSSNACIGVDDKKPGAAADRRRSNLPHQELRRSKTLGEPREVSVTNWNSILYVLLHMPVAGSHEETRHGVRLEGCMLKLSSSFYVMVIQEIIMDNFTLSKHIPGGLI